MSYGGCDDADYQRECSNRRQDSYKLRRLIGEFLENRTEQEFIEKILSAGQPCGYKFSVGSAREAGRLEVQVSKGEKYQGYIEFSDKDSDVYVSDNMDKKAYEVLIYSVERW